MVQKLLKTKKRNSDWTNSFTVGLIIVNNKWTTKFSYFVWPGYFDLNLKKKMNLHKKDKILGGQNFGES